MTWNKMTDNRIIEKGLKNEFGMSSPQPSLNSDWTIATFYEEGVRHHQIGETPKKAPYNQPLTWQDKPYDPPKECLKISTPTINIPN